MKKSLAVTVAVVLALMITSVALADLVLPTGTGLSTVTLQNLSSTPGDVATVHVDYYDPAGNKDGTSDATVNPLGIQEFKADSNVTPALPDGWVGSAVVSSDKQVGAVVSVRWSNTGNEAGTFDTNQREQDAYTGAFQGSNTMYLPDLKHAPNCPTNPAKANQVSTIYVQNTDGTPATVYLNFYNRTSGAFDGRVSGTIPAYSQKTWDMRVDSQMPPGVVANTTGDSAVITSTNNIYAIAQTTWCVGWDASYEGVPNGDTTLYAPIFFRNKKDANTWNLYSAAVVQNPNPTPVIAYFNFVNRNTGNTDLVVTQTVGSNAAAGLNTRDPIFDSMIGTGTTAVPNWAGSVIVTSTLPLVGSANVFWAASDQNYAGAYDMKGPTAAGSQIFVPAYYRRNVGGSWGSGSQWAAVVGQNLENVQRSATISFVNQAGVTVYSKTVQIAPNGGFGVNARGGGNGSASAITAAELQTALGDNFVGGAYISADPGSQFLVSVNIVYYDRSSVYNAFIK